MVAVVLIIIPVIKMTTGSAFITFCKIRFIVATLYLIVKIKIFAKVLKMAFYS
jgi:hypothetical protein